MNNMALNPLQQVEIDELNDFLRDVLGLESIEHTDALEQPEVRGRFKVETLYQVNWALRKMSALKADQANIEALARAEIDRIESWKNKKLLANKQSVAFFDYMLSEYAASKRAADAKYKGESTPYGKIGFRKQQPAWKYPNELATVEFLEKIETLREHVKTEKTISNKTQFKKAVEIKRNVFVKDGEVVDAAQATPGGWVGMQYMVKEYCENEASAWYEVIDAETGEVAEDVTFEGSVVVVEAVKVVPGVEVSDQDDAIDVKPEV